MDSRRESTIGKLENLFNGDIYRRLISEQLFARCLFFPLPRIIYHKKNFEAINFFCAERSATVEFGETANIDLNEYKLIWREKTKK